MCYVAVAVADEAALAAKFSVMRPFLDERAWRAYLGTEADALGFGGIAAVARASGASETTVAGGPGAGPVPPARRWPAEGGRQAARVNPDAGRAAGGGPARRPDVGGDLEHLVAAGHLPADEAAGVHLLEGCHRAADARRRLQPARHVPGPGRQAARGPGPAVREHQRGHRPGPG